MIYGTILSSQQQEQISKSKHYDDLFKLVIIGDSGVGKSCILLRFADDTFTDNYYSTIGVDFRFKCVDIGERKCKLQIWDTAGQERFKNIISSYYRGANGILLIYDITDKESFKSLSNWLIEIEKNGNKNVLKVLIGNKSDLEDKRVISFNQGKEFADMYGLKFIETSAKKNLNVNEAFESLGREIMESNVDYKVSKQMKNKKITVSNARDLDVEKKEGGCC